MSEVDKYKELLTQAYIAMDFKPVISRKEVLKSFDDIIKETNLKNSPASELIELLGQPEEYLVNYLTTRSEKNENQVIANEKLRNLKLRKPKFVNYPFNQKIVQQLSFFHILYNI